MVTLNRIYTKTGDTGDTALGTGERVSKDAMRVEAFGSVDETNAAIGLARLAAPGALDAILARVQNELFDLGADLCVPASEAPPATVQLRITADQVVRLEHDIDTLNGTLAPLKSFVLPAGTATAAHLHLARTIARRAERAMVTLARHEPVSGEALKYINRLSDLLFVMARSANHIAGDGDVLWVPGAGR